MPPTSLHAAIALLLAAVLAPAARALDFTPCTEPGHTGFDCATLPVPVDRDGTVPGTTTITRWQRNWLHNPDVADCTTAPCLVPLFAERVKLLRSVAPASDAAAKWNGEYDRYRKGKKDKDGASLLLVGLSSNRVYAIVSLWADFRAAGATVSKEAVEIRSLVREASLLPPASRDPLLLHLQQYVDAVVHEEWPAMASGGFANSAGRALTRLGSIALAAPHDRIDVRERVNKLAELRALRLGQTKSGIVPVLWFALLMIPIVLLGSFALAHDANPRFHYLLVGLVAGAVSLALFVALEIDLPYRGAASVSPGPIALAIQAAQSDDDIALPRN